MDTEESSHTKLGASATLAGRQFQWEETKFVVITGSRDMSELHRVLRSCSVRCWCQVFIGWYVHKVMYDLK